MTITPSSHPEDVIQDLFRDLFLFQDLRESCTVLIKVGTIPIDQERLTKYH